MRPWRVCATPKQALLREPGGSGYRLSGSGATIHRPQKVSICRGLRGRSGNLASVPIMTTNAATWITVTKMVMVVRLLLTSGLLLALDDTVSHDRRLILARA